MKATAALLVVFTLVCGALVSITVHVPKAPATAASQQQSR